MFRSNNVNCSTNYPNTDLLDQTSGYKITEILRLLGNNKIKVYFMKIRKKNEKKRSGFTDVQTNIFQNFANVRFAKVCNSKIEI